MNNTYNNSRICVECGYSLNGLDIGSACPECGAIDDESSSRIKNEAQKNLRRSWAAISVSLIFFLGIPIVAGHGCAFICSIFLETMQDFDMDNLFPNAVLFLYTLSIACIVLAIRSSGKRVYFLSFAVMCSVSNFFFCIFWSNAILLTSLFAMPFLTSLFLSATWIVRSVLTARVLK